MPNFDQIYQAAKNKEAKTIALLLLQGADIDEVQGLALTPAGKCLQEGDNDTFLWLNDKFGVSLDRALYGLFISDRIPLQRKEVINISDSRGNQIKIAPANGFESMAFVYGEKGLYDGVVNLLDSIGDSTEQLKIAAQHIAKGAIFAEHKAFYDKFSKHIKENFGRNIYELVSISAIQAEAMLGKHELLDKLVQDNRSMQSTYYGAAIRGAALAADPILFDHLRAQASYGLALRAAAERGHQALFFQLLGDYPKQSADSINLEERGRSQALEFAMMYRHFSWLNQLLESDKDYDDAAVGCGQWCESAEGLLNVLIYSDNKETAERLAQSMIARDIITKSQFDSIKQDVAEIIDVKQKYKLEVLQAKALQKHPTLLNAMLDKDFQPVTLKMMLRDKIKDSLILHVADDVINRVRQNVANARLMEAKTQLVQVLEIYPGTAQRWGNHLKRASDFLQRVKSSKTPEEFKAMVSRQHSFFSAPTVELSEGAIAIKEDKAHRSTRPPKNRDILDGYTEALEQCYRALK